MSIIVKKWNVYTVGIDWDGEHTLVDSFHDKETARVFCLNQNAKAYANQRTYGDGLFHYCKGADE